eukprot:6202325-Pleurochrysis_carterae.AAC.3
MLMIAADAKSQGATFTGMYLNSLNCTNPRIEKWYRGLNSRNESIGVISRARAWLPPVAACRRPPRAPCSQPSSRRVGCRGRGVNSARSARVTRRETCEVLAIAHAKTRGSVLKTRAFAQAHAETC